MQSEDCNKLIYVSRGRECDILVQLRGGAMEESQGSGHDSGEVSDRGRKIESAGKLDDCPLFQGPTKVANQELALASSLAGTNTVLSVTLERDIVPFVAPYLPTPHPEPL